MSKTLSILRGKTSGFQLSNHSIGILGIGFPQSNVPVQSWIVEAYDRSLIPAPVYMLALGRYDSNEETDGSVLVIGGYDESLIQGELNWISCSANFHVQIPMDGVIVNDYTVVRGDGAPMQAIVDVQPYVIQFSDISPEQTVLLRVLRILSDISMKC